MAAITINIKWGKDICVCVNFLMERRERREEVGTGDGRDMGPERLGNRPSGPQLAREKRSGLGQESALKMDNPA